MRCNAITNSYLNQNMTNQFNFEDAVKALQSGKKLNGKDGY